jgi:hypothetical protein
MIVELWTRKRAMGDEYENDVEDTRGYENDVEDTRGYEKSGVRHA